MESNHIDNYQIKQIIGKGSTSFVVEAIHKLTGIPVAIKMIQKLSLPDESAVHYVEQEIEILKKIDHPLITRIFEAFQDHDMIYIVMQLSENGSLLDYINNKKVIPVPEIQNYLIQFVEILDFLHNTVHVAHRDLKAENLLLDQFGNLSLIDFGLSKPFLEKNPLFTTSCGSPCYTAPEVIQGKQYGPSADIWSLGIILYAMFVGRLPFHGSNTVEEMNNIVSKKPYYPLLLPENVISLLKGLLKKNPVKRMTLNEIKSHPFLEGKMTNLSGLRRLTLEQTADDIFYRNFTSNFQKHKKICLKKSEICKNLEIDNNVPEVVAFKIYNRSLILRKTSQFFDENIIHLQADSARTCCSQSSKLIKYSKDSTATKSFPDTLASCIPVGYATPNVVKVRHRIRIPKPYTPDLPNCFVPQLKPTFV